MGIHGLLLVDHFALDFADFEVSNIFQKVSWQLISMIQIVFPELYRPIIKLHREWLLDVQLISVQKQKNDHYNVKDFELSLIDNIFGGITQAGWPSVIYGNKIQTKNRLDFVSVNDAWRCPQKYFFKFFWILFPRMTLGVIPIFGFCFHDLPIRVNWSKFSGNKFEPNLYLYHIDIDQYILRSKADRLLDILKILCTDPIRYPTHLSNSIFHPDSIPISGQESPSRKKKFSKLISLSRSPSFHIRYAPVESFQRFLLEGEKREETERKKRNQGGLNFELGRKKSIAAINSLEGQRRVLTISRINRQNHE